MPETGTVWPPVSKAAVDRLNAAEAKITANANALADKASSASVTAISNALADKASASALSTLSGKVDSNTSALVNKANASDVYTKSQTDAKVAPVAPFSTAKSYAVGDVSVFAGDFYRAVAPVAAAAATTLVGVSSANQAATTIPVPSGTAVGDMLVQVLPQASDMASLSGWTKLITGTNYLSVFTRTAVANDISGGAPSVTINDSGGAGKLLYAFRNAGVPTVGALQTSTNVNRNVAKQGPSWSPANGALALRLAFQLADGGFTSDPTMSATGTSNQGNFPIGGYASYYRGVYGLLTNRPVSTGDGTVTTGNASGAGNTTTLAVLDLQIPGSSGFVPAQWEKLLDVSGKASVSDLTSKANASDVYTKTQTDAKIVKLKAYSPTDSYAQGDPVTYQGDIYTANAAIAPVSAVTYVGKSSRTGSGNLSLPSGSAAGDLALIMCAYNGTQNAPSGWTQLAQGQPGSGSRSGLTLAGKILTSDDIAAGYATVTSDSDPPTPWVMRTYRGATMPSAPTIRQLNVSDGASIQSTSLAATVGSMLFSVAAFATASKPYTSNGSSNGVDTSAVVSSFTGYNFAAALLAAHGTAKAASGSTSTGEITLTAPGTAAAAGQNGAGTDLIIPMSSGFNASQWTKVVDASSKASRPSLIWRDTFDADSIANYTDRKNSGGKTFAIASGVLAGNSTTEKAIIADASAFKDGKILAKFLIGSTRYICGIYVKYVDANNFLVISFDSAISNDFQVIKNVGGTAAVVTQTSLYGTGSGVVAGTTSAWVVGRMQGNRLIAEGWKTDPRLGGQPTATIVYDITATGDINAFGAGVTAPLGIRTWNDVGGTYNKVDELSAYAVPADPAAF